jgi:hypothetical protein
LAVALAAGLVPSPSPAVAAATCACALVVVVGSRVARGRLVRLVAAFQPGLASFASPYRYLTRVAAWQALSWLLRVASLLAFLEAFGLGGAVRDALTVLLVQCLAAIAPSAAVGAGAQQGLLPVALDGAASTGSVLGFGLGMQVVTLVLNATAGAVALTLMVGTPRYRRAAAALATS